MKNPYHERIPEPTLALGGRWAWLGVALFLAVIAIPPAWIVAESVWGNRGGAAVAPIAPVGESGFVARLRGWEESFERLPLFSRWRASDQARLVSRFGIGNARVVVGRDGWLHYRPDVETVVGKGPRYVEPDTVARSRTRESWNRPLPVVRSFAGQLAERGIALVLVPVPTKAMIHPETLGAVRSGSSGAILPPSWPSVISELRNTGVEVIDLAPLLSSLSRREDAFLRLDTHWTPIGMEKAAAAVGRHLRERGLAPSRESVAEEFRISRESRTHIGDLAEMLGMDQSARELFAEESVKVGRVLDAETGSPPASDSTSPMVLLGDSFVNIYEDPALGFVAEDEPDIGAGFSSHLAAEMGREFHVIAINGGGATGVRRDFASLPPEEVSRKKVVVWVFSARDLFLAELPGRRARIRWEEVAFRESGSSTLPARETKAEEEEDSADPIRVEATVRDRSMIDDPTTTPYSSAIYSVLLTDVSGGDERFEGGEAMVFLRAFRDRRPLPSSRLEKGKRYRFDLVPMPESGDVATVTRLDDFFRADLKPWFALEVEAVSR